MSLGIVDIIGFAASALVFLTFCMRTLLPLRLVALASNVVFIAYGIVAGLVPILVLHLLLLPMNLWRTLQQLQTRQRMRAALEEEPNLEDLLPFATSADYPDGAVVFRRGEPADKLYIVVQGAVMVEDIGQELTRGALFGEIAFFTADGKRTATVRAAGPARLASIDRDTLIRRYRDNPDFALFLTRLMVTRLARNGDARRDGDRASDPARKPG